MPLERNVKCSTCGMYFTSNGITLHRRACGNPERCFTCRLCGHKCLSQSAISTHEAHRCKFRPGAEAPAKAKGKGKAKMKAPAKASGAVAKVAAYLRKKANHEAIERTIDGHLAVGVNVNVNDVDLSVFS